MAKTVKLKPETFKQIKRKLDQQSLSGPMMAPRSSGTNIVLIKNSSGTDCPRFGILGISGVPISP